MCEVALNESTLLVIKEPKVVQDEAKVEVEEAFEKELLRCVFRR